MNKEEKGNKSFNQEKIKLKLKEVGRNCVPGVPSCTNTRTLHIATCVPNKKQNENIIIHLIFY